MALKAPLALRVSQGRIFLCKSKGQPIHLNGLLYTREKRAKAPFTVCFSTFCYMEKCAFAGRVWSAMNNGTASMF